VLWASIGAVALTALLIWRLGTGRGPERRSAGAAPAPVAAAPEPVRTPTAAPGAESDPPGAPAAGEAGAGAAPDPSEGMFDTAAIAWSQVDLDEVRAAMPDNLYWQRSVPTSDPEVLRERERDREYWNHEYGKVLSNTASEEEVRAYYAHRQRLSADSVEVTTYLLDHYGHVLPERDVGLLALARRLHLARLEELPRDLSDALVRREAHEQARLDWLEQQRLFEDRGVPRP
jgi:hypothetical protein